MAEPEPLQDDRLIRRMSAALDEWLRQEDWQPQQLIDWLEGHKLPRVGYEDEPYVWILRGLPLGDERYWAETKLAQRVATVLEDEPDVKKPGKRPEQVLFNLFMLCAGLNSPDELNGPLKQVLKRRALKGEWLGVDLRYAFQVALTWNQLDRRLEPVWEAMLSKGHAFLPGDQYDGFEGILWMPPSKERRGEPCLDAIGRALKLLAQHLEAGSDTEEFRSTVERVVASYPSPTRSVDFCLQADANSWPVWAKACLPGDGDEEELGKILNDLPKELKPQAYDLIRRRPSPTVRVATAVGRQMAQIAMSIERLRVKAPARRVHRRLFAYALGTKTPELLDSDEHSSGSIPVE